MGSIMPGNDAPVEPDYVTQVVIVGTGPAGGSLAAFLGSHGRFETVYTHDVSKTDDLTSGQ